MNAKHLVMHVAVVAVGLGGAVIAGVPFASALPFALIASCVVMMLMMGGHGGHGGHQGHDSGRPKSAQDADHSAHTHRTDDTTAGVR